MVGQQSKVVTPWVSPTRAVFFLAALALSNAETHSHGLQAAQYGVHRQLADDKLNFTFTIVSSTLTTAANITENPTVANAIEEGVADALKTNTSNVHLTQVVDNGMGYQRRTRRLGTGEYLLIQVEIQDFTGLLAKIRTLKAGTLAKYIHKVGKRDDIPGLKTVIIKDVVTKVRTDDLRNELKIDMLDTKAASPSRKDIDLTLSLSIAVFCFAGVIIMVYGYINICKKPGSAKVHGHGGH
jgi:hypothetical protein